MTNIIKENGSGLVFNVQNFSIHDGPGIRTTIFMKGCPLRCQWCSNPESILMRQEVMAYDLRCIKCFKCVDICPLKAIQVVNGARVIDRKKCDLCLKCAEACPSNALEIVGKYMTADEVIYRVERDSLFYLNSDGGMTISGGEGLLQPDFVCKVFKECRNKGIHTALDTSGYAAWDVLQRVLNDVDLVLYDIKHMNEAMHKQGTGVSNEIILNNARRIAADAANVKIWLRLPVITGYNDSLENITQTAKFALEIRAEKISLLPYHSWGEQKYERLGRPYPLKGVKTPSPEHIDSLCEKIRAMGVEVTVGL